MSLLDAAGHWDHVFQTKAPDQVSWYQEDAAVSLRLLRGASGAVIDVGAGASTLVDGLIELGWTDITLVDVSADALKVSRGRLEGAGDSVSYVVADVRAWEPDRVFDAWHDRAVFHFLTEAGQQRRYVDLAARSVVLGGVLVLGSFAEDGPQQCSGLPVARYSADGLASLFAPAFGLEHTEREVHTTPAGGAQAFT